MRMKWFLVAIAACALTSMFGTAAFASNVKYYNGRMYCKGLGCDYLVTGTQGGGALTTGTCQAGDVTEVLLFCFNPANNAIKGSRQGAAFAQQLAFSTGLSLGTEQSGKNRGRSKYNAISNADGIASTPEECDNSEACTALRQFCTNPLWIPVDVVPVTGCAVMNVWECAPEGPCPCEPGPNGTCQDHDKQTPEIDPMMGADKVLYCTLPNPSTYRFGQARDYVCQDATPAQCPSFLSQ